MSRYFIPSKSPPITLERIDVIYPKQNYTQLQQLETNSPSIPKPRAVPKKREGGLFLKATSKDDLIKSRGDRDAIFYKTPPERVAVQHSYCSPIASPNSVPFHQKQSGRITKSHKSEQFEKLEEINENIIEKAESCEVSKFNDKPENVINLAQPPPKFFSKQKRAVNTQLPLPLVAPAINPKEQNFAHTRTPGGSAILTGETKQQIMFYSQRKLHRIADNLVLDKKRKYITLKAKEGNSILKTPALSYQQNFADEQKEEPLFVPPKTLQPLSQMNFLKVGVSMVTTPHGIYFMEH
ncbi:hypothetical protein EIN_176810 [Entamoeba invadens IP1]|uniref:hypothetical protein n=1 Tax=Entamoeba invadens IP1 TaxID=370355 RepID=UPI0002C3F399|nr:hypothetical protein EIN_176810 [Entamoeba invadens IP1]ELP93854.1 hypothetical protein EIN_176810 [Entamoeba invadens IP1]|eukprot:XP_004260625.1 hypothetical protein EIN_176810 [Entamoeba invadens IP1]